MVQWKYTSSRIPRFDLDVSKHNPYLYYPSRLLPILGYSDIPLVGGSRLSLLTIIILSHLLLTDEFPVANPIKHGRNHFVRRLHYAAGEVRSYTLYFPLHRRLWAHALRGVSSSPPTSYDSELPYISLGPGPGGMQDNSGLKFKNLVAIMMFSMFRIWNI